MNKNLTRIFAFAVLTITTSVTSAGSVDVKAIQKDLKNVPALELPARASRLVASASEKDRNAVAVAVVEAAIKRNPASTPAVVAAVTKGNPTVGASVVTAATRLQPQQATAIKLASANSATPSGSLQGEQPPNPRGTGEGRGHGDGAGHGKGNAYGHLKDYGRP